MMKTGIINDMPMRHKIIFILLGGLLVSCSQIERPAASGEPARVTFSVDIVHWDMPLTKAGESGAPLPDQAAVFFTLESGGNRLMLKSQYSASAGTWSLSHIRQFDNGFSWETTQFTDLAPFSSGTCECYYFEDSNGAPIRDTWVAAYDNRPYVNLGGTSAVYVDKNARYSIIDGELSVAAYLTPLTGRIRFNPPVGGTDSWSLNLYNVRYYERYYLTSEGLVSSTKGLYQGNQAETQGQYLYCEFANPDQKVLSLYASGRNYSNYYVREFTEDILAPGSSCTDNMPSKTNHNEWYCYDSQVYDNISLKFVVPGTFQMGGTDAGPVHQVTLTKSFYMGFTEVTRSAWYNVMGSPASYSGSDLPVTGKTWEEVQEFITVLNAKSGRTYRLPTEAEWEYAARGAQSSNGYRFSGSDICSEVAVWNGNADSKVLSVQSKNPNEWSFYDMSGNASEWVNDWYGDYPDGPVVDPKGPDSGTIHVRRGGNRRAPQSCLTVSYRDISAELEMTGFRLAMDAPTIR